MTEVKKDTYTLTIENDTEKSMITSVKKGTDERNMITDEINLEDDDASAKLTKAINPVAVAAEADTSSQAAETSSQSADTSSHSADTPPPPPPVAAAEEAAKQKLLDTQLTGKYTKYTLGTLMNVLSNKNGRNSIYRFRLLYHINDQLNNWTGKNGEELTSAIFMILFSAVLTIPENAHTNPVTPNRIHEKVIYTEQIIEEPTANHLLAEKSKLGELQIVNHRTDFVCSRITRII
jgi:hypothetical protein